MTCAQYSAVQPAGRSRRGLGYFTDEKAFPRNIQRFSCDFRLDITDFGKKCEIEGNKEKSRESGGSGQGKQPWRVGRYASIPGFPGLSRVSASPPGIPELVLSIPGLSRVSASPPGIPELVLNIPGIGD